MKNSSKLNSELIKLKDNRWLEDQRVAGKVAAKALILLEKLVADKAVKTSRELDAIADDFIVSNGCIPTFKNYKGFPNACCIGVEDNALVHGVPNDYVLQEGDLVKIDLGTTLNESIADTAITCIFGKPKSQKYVDIINATKSCLDNSIAAIAVGKRLGSIGNAIYKTAKNKGYNVIENYGGHGIDGFVNGVNRPHSAPFICNKGDPGIGIRFAPNMVLAIEPLLSLGSVETYVGKDGWTVYTKSPLNCHFEHTVYIHEDRVELITDRDNI